MFYFDGNETWGFPVGKLGITRLPLMVYVEINYSQLMQYEILEKLVERFLLKLLINTRLPRKKNYINRLNLILY